MDEKYRAWLIEVNTNPCLEESSGLLKTLLPRMVEDMLRLTVDRVFHRRKSHCEKVFKVDGYEDGENMWEFLCKLA